jgi:hypothetical protein
MITINLTPEQAMEVKSKLPHLASLIHHQYDWRDIKTFEDACTVLGEKPEDILPSVDAPDETAYRKLKIIIRAINRGWTPDWNISDERKWWPYFNLSSGFGFSRSAYDYVHSSTTVGSRLCFESEEKSDYCATQFLDLYKQFLS